MQEIPEFRNTSVMSVEGKEEVIARQGHKEGRGYQEVARLPDCFAKLVKIFHKNTKANY